MKRFAAFLSILLLAGAGCGSERPNGELPNTGTTVQETSHPIARPAVPAEIAVPDDQTLSFMAAARGMQIYECTADASGALAWKLRAPRAELFDDAGAQIGIHYGGIDKDLPAGPYWESSKDGSRVHGGSPTSVPNPDSIPLLRLQAADTSGNGIFSHVSYIHRLATVGGIAPTDPCTSGQKNEVPYIAQYYFYVAP